VSANEHASLPFSFECRIPPLIVYVHQIGYLMCFFNEKISDALLVELPDYEFARKVRREGSIIIPKRQENWTTFLEIFIIKFLIWREQS